MSFHEDLNQKLNVFFNRDWSVELSEQEEEKMGKNSRPVL